jgi:opine dehydrogenase
VAAVTRVAVVGAGPVGRATAAVAAFAGHETAIWSPSGAGTAPLLGAGTAPLLGAGTAPLLGAGTAPHPNAGTALPSRGTIATTGAVVGRADVAILPSPEAVASYDLVVIALPGHAYSTVLPRVLPSLHGDQMVVASGALSLLPLWIRENGGVATARPTVLGWGTTLCTARRTALADVEINTLRAQFEMAVLPAARGPDALATCRAVFGDRFTLVDNVLATTLSNINPVAHAAEALPNLTRMERGESWYLFDCLTPAAARIAEAIDRERIAIAAAFGLRVRSIETHYELSYHVAPGSVADIAAAIHARDRAPPGPTSLEHRYVLEDMPFGLVFYEALARIAGIPVPVTSAAVTFASAAYGRDFRAGNPFIGALGLVDTTPAELLARCAG